EAGGREVQEDRAPRALRTAPRRLRRPRRGLSPACRGQSPTCRYEWMETISGIIRIATMFVILIIGLIAGPAVSLYGSPTVSRVTAAAWASEALPPDAPSSASFVASSH